MRSFYIVLLVTSLLAVAEATSISTDATLEISLRSPSVNRHDASEKRLLRTNSAKKEDDTERAIAIPGLSKIMEWFKAFILKIKLSFNEGKQLSAWLKEEKTPDDVFKLLKLNTGTKNLMANPNLRIWSVYMTLYNKKNPTKMVTMLGTFTKTYGNLEVAKMIKIARRNPKTYKLANRLQSLQLTGWAQNGLSTDVVFHLLKVGEGNVEKLFTTPTFTVWSYFFARLNRYNFHREVDMVTKMLTVYDHIYLANGYPRGDKGEDDGIPSEERVVYRTPRAHLSTSTV